MKKQIVGKLYLHSGYNGYAARVNGKEKYCPKPHTEAEAQLWYAQLVVEHCGANGDVAGKTSVEPLMGLYLRSKEVTKTTDKNQHDKKRILDLFCLRFGSCSIDTLSSLSIEDWIYDWDARGNGGGAYNRYAHLVAAFNWLSTKMSNGNDMTPFRNPMRAITRPDRTMRTEEYVIEKDEWSSILQIIPNPMYRRLASILWMTGARPSEIIKATIDEWCRLSCTLDKGKHKTSYKGKTRVICFNDEAATLLTEAISERKQGYCLTNGKFDHLCGGHLCNSIQQAAKQAGRTKPVCAYSLRHSFSVRNLEAGHTINQVAAWLGNSVTVCENHYAHTLERLKARNSIIKPV